MSSHWLDFKGKIISTYGIKFCDWNMRMIFMCVLKKDNFLQKYEILQIQNKFKCENRTKKFPFTQCKLHKEV
jgi:hypothetical protein